MTTTISRPAELAVAPTPAWVTSHTDWEPDGPVGWARAISRRLGEYLEVSAGQDWDPTTGLKTTPAAISFGFELLGDDDVPLWTEARAVAAELLAGADALEQAATR